MRYAAEPGANSRVRADSGILCPRRGRRLGRRMDVRYRSITIRQRARLRNQTPHRGDTRHWLEESAWTPIPYWMDGAADVAETTYTPFQAEADAAPGSQLALFATYSYHGFITDRDGETLELEVRSSPSQPR